MTIQEKRHSPRIESLNLTYVLLGDDDEHLQQGMGRTLNISEKGVFIETTFELDARNAVLLTIGLADDLIEIKGRIVHSRGLENGRFGTGIDFVELTSSQRPVLQKFIQAFLKPDIKGLNATATPLNRQ